jgi:hypothetical protein
MSSYEVYEIWRHQYAQACLAYRQGYISIEVFGDKLERLGFKPEWVKSEAMANTPGMVGNANS